MALTRSTAAVFVVTALLLAAGFWAGERYFNPEGDGEQPLAPPEITLLAPANGSRIAGPAVELAWRIEGAPAALALWVDGTLVELPGDQRNHTLTDLAPGDRVAWRMAAGDSASATWIFAVNTPPAVSLLEPANGSAVPVTDPVLRWQGADGDGDALSYRVELGPAGEALATVALTDASEWRASQLTPGNSYHWRIVVDDGWQQTASDTAFFRIDYTQPALSLMEGLNISQKVGQMLMAKVSTFDQSPGVEAFLQDGLVGGVLVGRNSETTDAAAVLDFTNWLQQQNGINNGVPLLMVGDFEGGKMMNYASLMSPWPNPMGVGATDSTELARAFGYGYGTEMAALGFNMAFAPVFDVNTNPDNPIIGPRSFGSRPELVTRLGLEVLAGHREAGIISTVKHFPGHGDTSVDSHSGLPVLDFNRTRLEQVELAPFQAAIDSGVPALMTAHIAVPALDPSGRPATLSEPILTGLLRQEMGFEGVIVTDSIGMGAVSRNYGVLEAAGMAFAAGADILLYTGSNRTQLRAYHGFLMEEVDAGNITAARVNESVLRILKLKLAYGLFERYPAAADNLGRLGADEHLAAAREIANRSVTLVEDTAGLLPLDLGPAAPLLVVSPDNLRLENGNLSLAQLLADRGYNVSQVVLSHQVTSPEREAVLARANDSALVILATHHFRWNPTYYGNSQVELAESLYNLSRSSSIPVILLSVENPYDLRQLPPFATRLVAYNSSPTSMAAVVAAMTGEIGFEGRLPVEL